MSAEVEVDVATPEAPAQEPSAAQEPAAPPARSRALLLVVVLAAVVRLAYLLEYLGLPFLRGPLGDSNVYLAQARHVAEGEFGDATLLAMSPLYGYFLAALGREKLLAVVLQLSLGVAVTALIGAEVRRLFGQVAGVAAALLFLGYGMVPFYESKVLSDALGLDLAALAVVLYLRTSPRAAVGAGLVLGVAVLARTSLFFATPLFALAAFVPRGDEGWRAGALRGARFTACLALVFVAHAGWTYAHAGVAVPVVYASGGDNVIARSTRAQWTGDLGDVAIDRAAPLPGPWDRVRFVERALAGGGRDDLGGALSSIDLAGWAREAPARVLVTLSDVERTFQYGYYGERLTVRSLDLLPLTFPALALLAAIGAVLLARREGWRAVVPHLPLILGVLAVTTLYHPSSRYRLPMLLPFVWLGAVALAALVAQRRERWAQALGLAVLAVAGAGTYRGLTYELRSPAAWELTLAESYQRQWDVERAGHHAARARQLAPNDPGVRAVLDYLGAEALPEDPRSDPPPPSRRE